MKFKMYLNFKSKWSKLDLNSLTLKEQTNFLFISAPTRIVNEYILTM